MAMANSGKGNGDGQKENCWSSTQSTISNNETTTTFSDFSVSVNTTDMNTTLYTPSSTSDFHSSPMLIVLPVAIAVLLFLFIICVCFIICRKKNKSAQRETYNQYSHVDQTDFIDPPVENVRISQVNMEYECVQIPVYELEISVPKSSKESGFSETEINNSHFLESENYPSSNTQINGPQFSGPKDVTPNPTVSHLDNSPSQARSQRLAVTSAEVGEDENYFTLMPVTPDGFIINEPGSDSRGKLSNYFTLEKIET